MADLPKRSDTIYKEIEEFKDYELSQCVAYEMAVRNDDIQNLMNLAGINPMKFTINNYMDSIILNGNEKEIVTSSIQKLVDVYGFDYLETIAYKLRRTTFAENYPNEVYNTDGFTFSPYNAKIVDILTKDELNKVCMIEIELYNQENWVKDDDKLHTNEDFLNLSISGSLEWAFDEKSLEIIRKALRREQKLVVEYNFSRPMMKPVYTQLLNIDLNIALPEKELIEQIKHLKAKHSTYTVKEDADKKYTLQPKTPLELLGVILYEADDLICDDKNNCIDARKTLSKQQRLANMFYIYDGLKVNMTQRKIQNEVYNYYANQGIETKTLDGKTIKKYKEIAFDYIDNVRYKELVTGVKGEF